MDACHLPLSPSCKSWRSNDGNRQPEFLGYQYNGFPSEINIFSRLATAIGTKSQSGYSWRQMPIGISKECQYRLYFSLISFWHCTICSDCLIRQVQGFQLPEVHCGTVAHRKSGDAIIVTCIIWQCTTIALRWLNWAVCFTLLYTYWGSCRQLLMLRGFTGVHTVLINRATRHQIRGDKGNSKLPDGLYMSWTLWNALMICKFVNLSFLNLK